MDRIRFSQYSFRHNLMNISRLIFLSLLLLRFKDFFDLLLEFMSESLRESLRLVFDSTFCEILNTPFLFGPEESSKNGSQALSKSLKLSSVNPCSL